MMGFNYSFNIIYIILSLFFFLTNWQRRNTHFKTYFKCYCIFDYREFCQPGYTYNIAVSVTYLLYATRILFICKMQVSFIHC